MSSTYVHYSTPSSLPSDYALLSRYAAAHPAPAAVEVESEDSPPRQGSSADYAVDAQEDTENDALLSEETPTRRRPRRSSFPTSYVTPFNPTSMGPLPDKAGHRSGPLAMPTENTPLLAPLVPRIPEEVDEEDISPGSSNRTNIIWEEMRILSKYTVPVFG